MSDDYRDGCSKKWYTRVLVNMVYLSVWVMGRFDSWKR